jgi:hypothetical protein
VQRLHLPHITLCNWNANHAHYQYYAALPRNGSKSSGKALFARTENIPPPNEMHHGITS